MTEFADTVSFAVEQCMRGGADEAEAYIGAADRTTVKVYRGEIELFDEASSAGLGLRVFKDGRLGCAYTTGLELAEIARAAKEAVENSRFSQPDPLNGLPESFAPAEEPADLQIYSDEFDLVDSARKIEFVLDVESRALRHDRRVKACEDVTYGDGKGRVYIANSRGFNGSYASTACHSYANVIVSEQGDTQSGFAIRSGRHLGELDAGAVAEEAASRAVMLLGARSLTPRRATVVFDPLVFIQILGSLTPAFSAEAAQKGRSLFAGKVGLPIGADALTIVDNGRLTGGLGSAPFDDEGVATQETPVIKGGVLDNLLYNAYSARKDKRASTGNASRGSFKTPPGTSPTNLFVKPGDMSRDEIIAGVKEGLCVTSVAGLHAGVNPITGQFSVGASGLWISRGKPVRPVREITIASTLFDLLKNVVEVGSDLIFVSMGANLGSPTVAVQEMTIGGR